ncbi:hypothetical protein EJB05_20032 [Eragrostis curvula]|uniref:HVA22-like protein n=1 Tax=Eragrostis curvula TaxID=38414 RepID=A0A5J9UXN7_9POAL|nr:hypothetical protein EJB05_20032 [Eragrostis curvula]
MGGGGSGSFLKVLVNNLDVLAGYASVRAIETKSAVDDQQWLTYWVLYSFITLFELTFAPFNGASHVYEHFVRPIIVNQDVVNIWYIPKKDDSSKPSDVILSAQKYIEQNGPKAFENLVNKFTSSHPRRSILEEVEVQRRARIEREAEAREMNPFFNQDHRY